ncbi:hypothetical protein Ddc_14604 [Ditylenchus destructor]|nr:hypothetical protein Ddc_14604 [Ditylenchus destructor]
MESKFDDENISLMNHNRIDFPLYTQLDIFKFLRAYDLQKSCINVSKEWRNTIRRYAGELPKFRDQRDLRAIERLLVGEVEPETNQRRSEAYYQRVECVIRKRNARYFTAAGTVVSVLILVITSSILVLHNLHRDEDQSSRISIVEQDEFSRQAISNEDNSSGQSVSDEILAMVALSWTTMFLTRYCVWLFDKFGPGQPYQLILYTLARVILLSIISCVKIPDITFSKWLIVLPLYPFEVLFWIYVIAGSTCISLDDKFRSKEARKIRCDQRHLSVCQKIHCWMYAIFRTFLPPAFSTVLSLLFIHFWHSKGITVPSLVTLVAMLSAQLYMFSLDLYNHYHLKEKITLIFWIITMESKFDDENISLMNHNRIDFPLYTQLDIFKFLRAYDLQKSCINVSKDWRNTIRRYAGELPKFRDQKDLQAIEKLVVGETVLEANQRLSEAYYQHVECVIRKRNVKYYIAAATVVSIFILSITSSVLVLYNLHRDNEQSSGQSISDEVLAMVALSWTTLFFTLSWGDTDLSSHGRFLTGDVSSPMTFRHRGRFVTEDVSSPGRFVTEDVSSPGRFVTGDVSSPGRFVTGDVSSPRTFRHLDVSSPGTFRHRGRFVTWTFRHLDVSSPGTFRHRGRFVTEDVSSPGRFVTRDVSSPGTFRHP